MEIKWHPSPNFNDRNPLIALQYIVLHYTGTESAEAWLKAVCDPATELSAHYVIDDAGCVVQLIEESRRAWHAGKSFWRGLSDINSASIGIELANPGHERGYRLFPKIQITRLKEFLRAIIDRHNMNPQTCLLAHSDIAPTRKQDPGELFPWQELAQEKLGLWPEPGHDDYNKFDSQEVVRLLQTIGYYCEDNDLANKASRAALSAFQRRFYPKILTGEPDDETVARLRALVSLLAK